MLAEAKNLNRKELSDHYFALSKAVNDSLDALHALASFHSWTFDGWADADPHPAHPVLFSCFHKTLFSLHAAHELTMDGLYGVARPHLRQAFESLMIAKFCAIDPESDVFDKWIDGVDLYFTNAILRKLAQPLMEEFADAWRLLCQWSHATVYANQLTMDIDTTREQAGLNIAFVSVLINFAYHLLNTHVLTPSIKYYAKRYGRSDDKAPRASLKSSMAVLRECLGPDSRSLVRDYKARWKLK
jgi:hypothetical protein